MMFYKDWPVGAHPEDGHMAVRTVRLPRTGDQFWDWWDQWEEPLLGHPL